MWEPIRRRRALGRGGAALWVSLALALPVLCGGGCGCGDDVVPTPTTPPPTVQPARCCCDLQWEAMIQRPTDVQVTLANADPTLNATAAPTFFAAVPPGTFLLVNICVDDNHAIGATLDVVFTDAGTAAVLATANLSYDQPCTPRVLPGSAGVFNVICPP